MSPPHCCWWCWWCWPPGWVDPRSVRGSPWPFPGLAGLLLVVSQLPPWLHQPGRAGRRRLAGGALSPCPRGGAPAAALGGGGSGAAGGGGGGPRWSALVTGRPCRAQLGARPVWRCCRWRRARRSCAIGCMTWTGSSAAPWPTGCSPCCWAAATPRWCSGSASSLGRESSLVVAGRHPGRGRGVPAGPPPRPGAGGSALQPPPLRRRPDHRGVQRPAAPAGRPGHPDSASCWPWSSRPCSRPRRRCGCDRKHPRSQLVGPELGIMAPRTDSNRRCSDYETDARRRSGRLQTDTEGSSG